MSIMITMSRLVPPRPRVISQVSHLDVPRGSHVIFEQSGATGAHAAGIMAVYQQGAITKNKPEGTRPGKHTKNHGKSPCLMGKSTISMAIFHSYFDITRGYMFSIIPISHVSHNQRV